MVGVWRRVGRRGRLIVEWVGQHARGNGQRDPAGRDGGQNRGRLSVSSFASAVPIIVTFPIGRECQVLAL
jgi:hypothetical protein